MHHDMLLLAERLVAAMENMSQDVKNISAYVYDLTCTVSHFLNEKAEKESIAPLFCDVNDSNPSSTPAAELENSTENSWQNKLADGNSVFHFNDMGHREISLGDASLTEVIKTEDESETEENYESCGAHNTSDNYRHDARGYSEEMNKQPQTENSAASCSLPTAFTHSHPLSVQMRRANSQKHFSEMTFPVASCSTVDETVCQEEAVDIHLPKRQEEEQAAEVRQRQFIDQSESARSTYSEVTCFAREMLRLTSSAGSEGRRRGFECSVCKQLCASNSALIVHMRVHTGERPYKCSWCEKSFQRSGHLSAHMRIHKDERPHKCSQCEKAFHQRGDLTRHMQMHVDDRPFKCSQCGKSFQRRGHLTVHMRMHTGEKPFGCDQCGKAFRYRVSLNLHKRTHTEREVEGRK